MRGAILLPLLFFSPFLAQAKIGDDLTALRVSYGSASKIGDQMLFKHDGYSIAVSFDGGLHAAMEVFVRDGSIPTKPDMTQADIDEILILEGDGQTWSPVVVHSGEPTWLRADHKLIARFSPADKILAVLLNANT